MGETTALNGQANVRLTTPRTVVRLADNEDVDEIIDYYSRNRERLKPFDPERPAFFYETRFWRVQVRQNRDDLTADRALRLFVFDAQRPGRVIGNIGFSNFVRGVGQYCTLGYSVDGECEGGGYMREALEPALEHAFSQLHFHRIEANYMPHNRRSANLLRRLGFVVEGYSRDYLQINGQWEDHIRTALLNPHWMQGGRS